MKEHGICAKCKKSVGCPYADDRIKGCKKFILEDELELTDKEWLHTLNTEQLAEWIFNILLICSRCGDESQSDKEKIKKCPFGKIGCTKKDWIKWLKEKHNE